MPYVGEIRAFRSEVPEGWLRCEGQHLNVDDYPVLVSLIEYRFGGNGGTEFALPDLRGRATAGADPRHGQGPGATSGLSGDDDTEIPYGVVRWGICSGLANDAQYPTRVE
jgi:microcystin-dependent protein